MREFIAEANTGGYPAPQHNVAMADAEFTALKADPGPQPKEIFMLNSALPGAGRSVGVHAAAITSHPGSRLVAVSDINADAAEKLAVQYGAEARSTDAILTDPAIDAVLIATSPTPIST